jgi:Uncharacterised nucleotidyltransferase
MLPGAAGELVSETSAQHLSHFSPEWRALLECVDPCGSASHLTELVRAPVRWPHLVALAEDHGVLPLMTRRLDDVDESFVPSDVRRKLRELSRARILFDLRMLSEMYRILGCFEAKNVEALLTKGPVLAVRCYGDSGMRQYTDLDFVLRDADVARATQAMIELGYEPKVPMAAIHTKKAAGEYAFFHGSTKLLVELHTERTFRYHPKPLSIDRVFKRQARLHFGDEDIPALSLEDELVLICIHGAKHFWERLLWIADVAALVSRQSIDWGRAIAAAGEVNAERMWRMGLLLSTKVAGAALPDHVVDEINSDAVAVQSATQIACRLPVVDDEALGLARRAAFRMRMRGGGFFLSSAYLLRLSLFPTEEDWGVGTEGKHWGIADAISRPFRLARKYGRSRGT